MENKKVDDSWKNAVEKEKEILGEKRREHEETSIPEAGFPLFISTIGMQALAALGEIPLGAGDEKKTDLAQAQYLIEALRMLSEKTKGNLTQEEEAALQGLLFELQMKFVQKTQASPH